MSEQHRTVRAADVLAARSPEARVRAAERKLAEVRRELVELARTIARAAEHADRNAERGGEHARGLATGLTMARRWADRALSKTGIGGAQ